MKSFACGDVVPGCEARWVCTDEQEVLHEVARHAAEAHGLTEVPDDVVSAVRAAIVDVPA
jgi:predicted small metal-binding protein